MPFGKGRPPRERRPGTPRPADGLEGDLARWLPALFEKALGRRPSQAISLTSDELYATGRAVRALSRGFTGERGLAGERYLSDPRSLAAYLLYFWPVSYHQARLLFGRLLPPGTLAGADVLDAGSGPGPLSAAALDCGARRVLALDADRASLRLARELAAARGFRLETGAWDLERSGGPPAGRFRLILLGHVLNELWPGDPAAVERRAARVETLASRLEAGGLVVILEPALLSTTRDLLRLRDRLAGRGFKVFAPCLRQGPCPCLADETSTCHADYPWRPPAWHARLAHAARLGKESLRFSLLAVGAPDGAPAVLGGDAFRVVSERMLSKSGRLRCFICNERGRFTLSAKPARGGPWLKTFLGLRRYDAVRVARAEPRENGLGLLPESVLEKISVWGE